jgi:hypothetical protein
VADCTSSFVIAAYQYVRFIPQDSYALHNELFTGPSIMAVCKQAHCETGVKVQNTGSFFIVRYHLPC